MERCKSGQPCESLWLIRPYGRVVVRMESQQTILPTTLPPTRHAQQGDARCAHHRQFAQQRCQREAGGAPHSHVLHANLYRSKRRLEQCCLDCTQPGSVAAGCLLPHVHSQQLSVHVPCMPGPSTTALPLTLMTMARDTRFHIWGKAGRGQAQLTQAKQMLSTADRSGTAQAVSRPPAPAAAGPAPVATAPVAPAAGCTAA